MASASKKLTFFLLIFVLSSFSSADFQLDIRLIRSLSPEELRKYIDSFALGQGKITNS